MKRFLLFIPLYSIFVVSSCFSPQDDESKRKALMKAVLQTLNSEHYQPMELNDQNSVKFYGSYLKVLDYQKRFFTQQDIAAFSVYEKQVDDQIRDEKFEFYNLVSSTYKKRLATINRAYEAYLSKPLDLNAPGSIETDADKRKYPADTTAMLKEWQDYFRYQVVSSIAIDLDIQDKAKSRKDTVVKIKTLAELETSAREKTLKNNRDYFKRLSETSEEDLFADFLNAIARTYDPHTDYETPKEKENFDIAFTGQFEGIGATLSQRDGFIKVTNIIPGSASWRQGQLKVDDVFLKVAQAEGDPVDVVNMKVDDAIKLIRGKKGTTVKLTVRKPDGSILVIPIVRDVVILEETYAKSAILKHDKVKGSIGYINLPSFYADFSNSRGGRNCYEDIKKEINKLKADGISRIILDLRSNGGGSLQDVVKIGGLFVDQGPVVQVKTKEGSPYILDDPNPGVDFDGKLVIMTNFFSASASEILAAALQDYKRAVVVGSTQTYGKGTVQKMTDLSHFGFTVANLSERPSGTVKLTTQKFYRINGGATQLRGVTPDIILPDVYEKLEVGEKELDFVMNWDQTTTSPFETWSKKPDVARLKLKSKERVSKNPYFRYVEQEAVKLKQRQDASIYALDLKGYQAQQAAAKDPEDKAKEFSKNITGFNAESVTANIEINKSNPAKEEVEKGFIQRITKDYYLEEAMYILAEM
ncbi:MAG TPA: carboxy terminal-processing peptidase [Catalimonadaceae bacterium]|nr:carboxy terminal-processing peptidase [Catalimonadaceae bacterium]